MKHITYLLNTLTLSVLFANTVYASGPASDLFSDVKHLVYQIQVIDQASGNKSSLGSGFRVSKDGLIATNFHVVASYVHKPEKFRLQYEAHDGSTGNLDIKDIDVIHDLAILTNNTPSKDYLKFNKKKLTKGDRIYSMGNPHDLAMTIIEGNYNGLLQTSRYQKILFSGSLNPGMSGGPAMDRKGRIIGVNVAKGGEQISFLVPVRELAVLLAKVQNNNTPDDFEQKIEISLFNDQESFYKKILAQEWESEPLGEMLLPGKISNSMKCWGHTQDKEDLLYKAVHQHCHSQDIIYLSNNMYTGTFFYEYEWITSEKLNRFQFYNFMQERFTHRNLSNVSYKEDATNYICETGFVEIDNNSWKVSSCLRAYKKYSGLFDMLLLYASVDMNNKGAIIKTGATGISRENANHFTKKITDSIKWINDHES